MDTQGRVLAFTYLASYADKDLLCRVLTLALATKINFFATNHHKGQGEVTKFVRKVTTTLFPTMAQDTPKEEVRNATHTIGHWMSTHIGMNVLGMATGRVVAVTPLSQSISIDRIGLASDFKARSDSFPAGTAPNALVYNALKDYSGNRAWLMSPYIDDMIACSDEVKVFKASIEHAKANHLVDPRLQYHMGAAFLTGAPRKTFVHPAPIGAVGSFLFNLRGGSTLAQSPLITRTSGTGHSREKEYMGKLGYDEEWEVLCAGLRGQKGTITEAVSRALSGVSAKGIMSKEAYVRFCSISGTAAEAAKANYEAALSALEEDDEEMDEDDDAPPLKRKKAGSSF